MANWRPTTTTPTASIDSRPATLRATTTASVEDAMLTSITPTASPTQGPSSRTQGASRSEYTGPGLFTFSPTDSDADVHDPSSGWCDVPTSRARTSRIPLSPTGCQPLARARTVATTIGTLTATRSTASRARPARVGAGASAGSAASGSAPVLASLRSVVTVGSRYCLARRGVPPAERPLGPRL